jgi:hypothetical protein
VNLLRDLYWNGVVKGDLRISPRMLTEMHTHLDNLPKFPGHVPTRPHEGTWCPPISGGTTTAPHFLDFATQFTDFAEEYLGSFPYLYSTHSFWTKPAKGAVNPDIQHWHRDRDDKKFVAMFMFGTDVLDANDGPHMFVRGSHRVDDGRTVLTEEPDPKTVIRIYGKAGEIFFANTFGFHMGMRPTLGVRLLHWARWGVSCPPAAYGWDKVSPVPGSTVPMEPPDEKIMESTKFLVDWDK